MVAITGMIGRNSKNPPTHIRELLGSGNMFAGAGGGFCAIAFLKNLLCKINLPVLISTLERLTDRRIIKSFLEDSFYGCCLKKFCFAVLLSCHHLFALPGHGADRNEKNCDEVDTDYRYSKCPQSQRSLQEQ